MSVFVNFSGERFIECNCCHTIADSNHGSVVDGVSNDTPPIGWKTETFRVPCSKGYYWKKEHFCNNCGKVL